MRRNKNTKTFFVAIMIAVILVLSIGYEAIFSFNDTEPLLPTYNSAKDQKSEISNNKLY